MEKEMDIGQIKNLLDLTKEKITKYKEIHKVNSLDFRFLNILKMESNENAHSDILAEMLNPSGSHNMEDKFLSLFIKTLLSNSEILNYADIHLKDFKNFKIQREKNTKNGRIDIFVKDKSEKLCIIIENKIYAAEQQDQMNRYFEWAKENKKNYKIILIYLTLDGKECETLSEKAKEDTDKDKKYEFLTLSYSDHIIKWLELCIKEVALKPSVREFLNQYILTLKELTNQSLSSEEEKEMKDIILKDFETYKAAEKISQSFPNVNIELKKEIIIRLFEEIGKKYGTNDYKIENNIKNNSLKKWMGFYIYKENWETNDYIIKYIVEAQSNNFTEVYVGLVIYFKETEAEENKKKKEEFIKSSMPDLNSSKLKENDFYIDSSSPFWIIASKMQDIYIEEYIENKDHYFGTLSSEYTTKIKYLIENFSEVIDKIVIKDNTTENSDN